MHKLPIAVSLVSLMLAVSAAHAVDEHHPEQKGAPAKAAPKDTQTPATKAAVAPAARDAGMPMGMMQDNMLKMHEQMHKIMQAKDPKERERLRQEHLNLMQDQMKMMGNGMMGPGMMGGGGKGGGMGAPAGK